MTVFFANTLGGTLSNNNLTVSGLSSRADYAIANLARDKGKWYWEITLDSGVTGFYLGIIKEGSDPTNYPTDTAMYYASNGNTSPPYSAYGIAMSVGGTVGVMLDLNEGNISFSVNGINQGMTNLDVKSLGSIIPVIISAGSSNKTITANFGATPFKYGIPNGYLPYNQPTVNKILLLSNGKTVVLNRDGYDENENLIPVMTSNTAPSGIASASSAMSTSYSAWRAFDKVVTGNGWETNSSNGWLQYEFTQPIRIVKYSIYPRVNFTSNAPKDWTFEGSNDGTNWTVLDTQVNISNWNNGIAKNYNIINNIEYKNYRLNISSSNSYSGIKLGELEMYSNKINKITTLPSYSEQNLIKYGMNSPVQVDGIFTDKNYILSTTESINTSGLLQTQINRKPLSIKFS